MSTKTILFQDPQSLGEFSLLELDHCQKPRLIWDRPLPLVLWLLQCPRHG